MRRYILKTDWRDSPPDGFFCCDYSGDSVKPHSFKPGNFITNDVEWVARLCGVADRVSGSDTSTKLTYGKTTFIDCRSLGSSVDCIDNAVASYESVCEAFGKSRFRGTLSATVAQFLPRNPFCEESPLLATEVRFGAYHGGIQINNSAQLSFVTANEYKRLASFSKPPLLTGQLPYSVTDDKRPKFPNVKVVGSLFMFDINAAWPTALGSHCYRFTNMRCDDIRENGVYFVEVKQGGVTLPLVPHKNDGRCEWGVAKSGQIWADSELIAQLVDAGYEISVIFGYASMPDESGSQAIECVSGISDKRTSKDALRALCGRVAMRPHTSEWIRDETGETGRLLAGWVHKELGEPGPFPRQADPTWAAYMCSVTNRKVIQAARKAIDAGYRLIWCDTDSFTVTHREQKTLAQAVSDIGIDYGAAPGQFGTRIVNTSVVYWGPKGYLSNQRCAEAITPAWVAMLDKEHYGFARD